VFWLRVGHTLRVARVTVFIPTYNRAGLLPHAIAGVLAQTYGDFRLIVSDNASEDETPDVVAKFDDPRLEYVRHPENLGLLGNHNWFLERVDSDYALILPDDDLVYPELLDRTVAELDSHPGAGMAHAAFDIVDEEGKVLLSHVNWTYSLDSNRVESAGEFIAESMRWSCRVCASTALMRTAALPADRVTAGPSSRRRSPTRAITCKSRWRPGASSLKRFGSATSRISCRFSDACARPHLSYSRCIASG
jgi:cellulose synthase/poly-beta-1,6-N-acetylglucosamine synthase-like glycosyltransferase